MRLVALATAAAAAAAQQWIEPGYADVHGGNSLRVYLAKNVSRDGGGDLKCHFGSHIVPAVLYPDRVSVGCMVPPIEGGHPGNIGLSVTASSHPLTDQISLAYYDILSLPKLASVSPRSAQALSPVELRIRGENFAPLAPGQMKCRFRGEGLTNASFIAHDEIACASPLVLGDDKLSRTVPLQITLDGAVFSTMGEVEFTIESHLPSNISSISPSHGPTDGNTQVEVHGAGFNPFMEVRWTHLSFSSGSGKRAVAGPWHGARGARDLAAAACAARASVGRTLGLFMFTPGALPIHSPHPTHPGLQAGRELDISCHFHNGRDWNRETVATFYSANLIKCSTPSYQEHDEHGW